MSCNVTLTVKTECLEKENTHTSTPGCVSGGNPSETMSGMLGGDFRGLSSGDSIWSREHKNMKEDHSLNVHITCGIIFVLKLSSPVLLLLVVSGTDTLFFFNRGLFSHLQPAVRNSAAPTL